MQWAIEQIVGRVRREREVIADFQFPIVDLNSRRRVNSDVRWLSSERRKHGKQL